MKYTDTGFRMLYQNFALFPMNAVIRSVMEGWPGVEEADCVLTFGYIHHEEGFLLEILAAGNRAGNTIHYYDTRFDTSAVLRISQVEEEEFQLFENDYETLLRRYIRKVDPLGKHETDEALQKTRTMLFLDECRDPYHVDDVTVRIARRDCASEDLPVRIEGLDEQSLQGMLMEEPRGDLGIHKGSSVRFYVMETEDRTICCYADLTPPRRLTEADLEDGTILKDAIHTCNAEKTQANAMEVFSLLHDSDVWIPCRMEQSGERPAQMLPQILQSGETNFYPVFSSPEEGRELAEQCTFIRQSFLEAVLYAREHADEIEAIVVNALTEPFFLGGEIYPLVESMETRVIREKDPAAEE